MTRSRTPAIVTGPTSGIGLGIARADVVVIGFGDADAIATERAALHAFGAGRVVYGGRTYRSPTRSSR